VREAYSLLRQSIIHVEQDDINFDDEEDAGLAGSVQPNGSRTTMDEDESMDAADISALDAAESSYNAQKSSVQRTSSADQAQPASGKKKMRITCEFARCISTRFPLSSRYSRYPGLLMGC
jgi:DNA replication licensing factor MCM6